MYASRLPTRPHIPHTQLDPSIVVSHIMPLDAAANAYKMLGDVRMRAWGVPSI